MSRALSSRSTECRRPQWSAGFTLLELLLAITLLGLMAVMLAGGVRLGARVWETGESRAEEIARLEVVQGFLRRQLGEARPLRLYQKGKRRAYAFEGEPERVRFAALAPPQFDVGGFYLVTVELVRGADGERLLLTARPFHPEMDEGSRGDEIKESVLLTGVAAAEFSYFGARRSRDPPEWDERWEGLPILPRLVRLRLEFTDAGRYWPEFVVAPGVMR